MRTLVLPVLDSLMEMVSPGFLPSRSLTLRRSKSPVRMPLLMPRVRSRRSLGFEARICLMELMWERVLMGSTVIFEPLGGWFGLGMG